MRWPGGDGAQQSPVISSLPVVYTVSLGLDSTCLLLLPRGDWTGQHALSSVQLHCAWNGDANMHGSQPPEVLSCRKVVKRNMLFSRNEEEGKKMLREQR